MNAANISTNSYTYGNMVNPHHICIIYGDCVATPDVFRIDICNEDVPDEISQSIIIISGNQSKCRGKGEQVLFSGKLSCAIAERRSLRGSFRRITYCMIILLAPDTMRRPLPLITPAEPSPRRVLSEATVIPSTPALSLLGTY